MFPEAKAKLKNRKKKPRRNRLLYAGWLINLPRFQGARPDHVRVESSSCCFPGELVRFCWPKCGVSEF